VQKEKRFGVDGHEDVILEFRDEATFDGRFFLRHVGDRPRLQMFGLQVQLETGQREDHLSVVVGVGQFRVATATPFHRVVPVASFPLQRGEFVDFCNQVGSTDSTNDRCGNYRRFDCWQKRSGTTLVTF
jgi:hypothetical protein